ncbi:MAG: hypothetical protein H0W68_13595 [Gemmatimonadaceae bacterium]|nr:hypothetical protein [Gemmatimonadaceae bacterium]
MVDTAAYYHAAYIAAAVLYVGYAVSLVVRRRKVLARLAEHHATGRR